MPYKPTGNPPGRPRKPEPFSDPVIVAAINKAAGEEAVRQFPGIVSDAEFEQEQAKPLSRAREGFRRAAAEFKAALHTPPRFGKRRATQIGKRPMLHPNVIAKV